MRYLIPALALCSCAVPYKGACEDLAAKQCEICPQESDYDELACSCIANGTLTENDGPDGYFEDDDDAAMTCSSMLFALQYPSESSASYCKQEVEMLEAYDKDYCEWAYGYGTYYSTSTSTYYYSN